MPKTVTLRLDDVSYNIIKNHAISDNRPLSNYIETATLKYIEEVDYVDDFEMESILNDEKLKAQTVKFGKQLAKQEKEFQVQSSEFEEWRIRRKHLSPKDINEDLFNMYDWIFFVT